MPYPIIGLHHVTATVDEAQADLDFCVDAIGLRLVKKTVNFDNHHVYHFYYGTERGAPGTIWTTFPYHGRGVRVGTKGAGQVTATSFSVPSGTLDFWKARLKEKGSAVEDAPTRFGETSIFARDPSGLVMEIVATDRDSRQAWSGGDVDPGAAVRGLHSVSMTVRDAAPTVEFMTGVLGYSVVDRMKGRIRVSVNGDAPGHTIDIVEHADAAQAINGLGTVHHVAMAIEGEDQQAALRNELIARGLQVTPVLDRQYFRSIYFREPGGVLFEVATVAPGFTVDETLQGLGQDLKLPPWEEPNRVEIEAGLPRIEVP